MPTVTVIQTGHPSSTMGTCAPEYSRNTFSSFPGETPMAVTTRQVSLRDMVVTPDRVPKFTIPSLGPPRRLRAQNLYKLEKSALGSPDGSRRHTVAWLPRSPPSHRTYHPGPESEFIFWGELAREDLSDPVSRAALSLPHLPKITTPYGFLTLGESPSVRRRESLFFEDEIPRICISGTADGNLLLPYTLTSPIPRTQSYPMSDFGNLPWTVRRTLRSLSCDAATSLSCDSHQAETRADSLHTSRDSRISSPLAPACSGRGRLQRLLKKRLAAVRTLKPSRCWVKRCSIDKQSKQKAGVTPETNTTIDGIVPQ